MTSTELAAAARALRNVRIAQQDGATWAQLAPLLHVPDGKQAKAQVRRLERVLRPVAQAVAARKGWDRRQPRSWVAAYQQEVAADEPRICGPFIESASGLR